MLDIIFCSNTMELQTGDPRQFPPFVLFINDRGFLQPETLSVPIRNHPSARTPILRRLSHMLDSIQTDKRKRHFDSHEDDVLGGGDNRWLDRRTNRNQRSMLSMHQSLTVE